ncbi:MAG: paraquat-inducible protein A [Desulforhopalus sp.]|jgi:paraquat-inducible protein A
MNNRSNIIICPECDLLLPKRQSPVGYSVSCPRCGKRLRKRKKDSVVRTFVLSMTGLLLYLPAVLLPLMTFKSLGFSDSANVIESIVNFYTNDYYFVSLMVFLSAFLFPLLLLTMMFFISYNLFRGRYPYYLRTLFRNYLHLEEWAMIEVYLLGIMVTIIKMADSSEIVYQPGIFCFVSLVLLSLAISTTIDKEHFWNLIETNSSPKTRKTVMLPEVSPNEMTTGLQQQLTPCHTCAKVLPTSYEEKDCPRCGSKVHNRIPGSVGKTWALVFTSIILFVPANLLPIMEVDFLGVPERSTILDGIIYFFQHGSYGIGLVIFTASILVPVFKIIGLSILLFSTHPSAAKYLKNKTKMYRSIAFIGRWSMLDIFVIALLTVLVDYGFFTSIYAAPAATYFCFVVACTMLAAITFDPRIMWDNCPQAQLHSTSKTHKP